MVHHIIYVIDTNSALTCDCHKRRNRMSRSPELDQFRKGEGSLKLKAARPRSRTGSGGILRLDIGKTTPTGPRDLNQFEPASPQPSIDRLSVTFATDERNSESPVNVFGTPPISCMEKVRFPTITDGEDSPEEDDYSASVTAIMQRRASTRKSRRKSRRTSSPFSHENDGLQVRRRSSCVTTSSGDTAISIEESLQPEVTQEQIFENIRLHKEVLGSVKLQPWDMRRKIKLVQQAKSYIKRHEGVLQERLAQSRYTRDILARWNIFLVQQWQHYKRELANLSNILIPWESRIKEIESHFGSVVASYFTFLRWLFWVNLVISVILVAFVAVPELLTADPATDGERKVILAEEKHNSTNLFTLWDFEGVLKYSPLFYGYYTDKDHSKNGYRLPFAYFMTGLAVYIYSFVATLRKMAENSRMSKLSEKDDECVFSWKLFTGWDYMIGNAETAQNRVASIILGFKEALLEEAEKKREPRNWKIISARIFVNLVVALLLVASAYAVVQVVQRSRHKFMKHSWWGRNEITVVMSLISLIFPIFFEVLGFLEHYHPRKQLRLQLARIMVLNLLNLYSMIFALFAKIQDMTIELKTLEIKAGLNKTVPENCTVIYVDCPPETYPQSASLTSAIWTNLSLALILTQLNPTNITTNLSNPGLSNLQLNLHNSTNFVYPVQRAEEFEEYFDFSEYDNETDYEYFKTTEASRTTTEEYYYDFSEYGNETYYDLDDVTTLEPDNGVLENYIKNYTKGMKDVLEDNVEGLIGKIREYIVDRVMEVIIGNTNENLDELQTSLIRNATVDLVGCLVINGTKQYLVEKLIQLRSNLSEVSDEVLIDLLVNWSTGYIGTSTEDIIEEQTINLLETLTRNLTMDLNETWTRNIHLNHTLIDNLSKSLAETLIRDLVQSLMKQLSNNVTENMEYSTETWTEYDYENITLNFTDVSRDQFDNITNITDLPETWNGSTTIDPILFNYSTQTGFPNTTLDYFNQTELDSNTTQLSNKPKDSQKFANTPIPKATEMPSKRCQILHCENITKIDTPKDLGDLNFRKQLRNLCWETMFGQELVKLTIMDLSFTILSTLAVDFIRALFVRIMNNFWCWDLEKQFPQYGDFKIAENILHLVNNQGMVWMGMFFSPGLTVINLIKLAIMMYLRSWAVLTCNVPHEVVFRASRSNNFYLALLLTMLFLCVLPVGYAMVWIKPSWHCGPFSNHTRIYHIFTDSLENALPSSMHQSLDYIASPFIVIPLLVLLVLIIYYMISLTNALREANNDLKMQLRRERTEERRKMFQMADRKRRGASGDSADFESTPFGKWKKLLPILPSTKSFDADTPNKDGADKKDKLASFIRKAIKKPSGIQKPVPPPDDATDTEQHDSLPEDINNSQEHENKILLNLKKMIQAKKQNAKLSSKLSNQETSTPDKKHEKSQEKSPKRRQVQRKADRIKSSSKSSSSKDMRQDSLTSNWSDNIPVIKISEIESTDCILEHQTDSLQRKLKHQRNIDESQSSEMQMAEPQCESSTETLVTVRLDESKVLARDDSGGRTSKFDIVRVKEKSSIDTELSVDLMKSINSDTCNSSQTKTEDSSHYKE